MNLFDVQDRVVIVTGGLGQLGRQFTLALLDNGARVAILDVQASDELLAKRFGKVDAERLMCVAVDVTERASVEAALARVTKRWGAPHALVNNAALDSPPGAPASENGPFEDYPD